MYSTCNVKRYGLAVARAGCWIAVAAFVACIAGCGGDDSEPPTVTSGRVEQNGAAPAEAETNGAPDELDSKDVGDLAGVVVYDGPAPQLPLLVSSGEEVKNAEVCSAHDIPDQSLQVNPDAGGGLANVFIFLPKAPAGAKAPAPGEPVVFDQKGCVFLQHALVVQAGQTVLVKSGDPIAHNVHIQPLRNQEFNRTIQKEEREGIELVYDRPELVPVAVKCDVHPWMKAYHLVVDHPFAAVTDSQGRFAIRGLPAGKHKFRVWHERGEFLETGYEVEIEPGRTTEITLTYPADRFQ